MHILCLINTPFLPENMDISYSPVLATLNRFWIFVQKNLLSTLDSLCFFITAVLLVSSNLSDSGLIASSQNVLLYLSPHFFNHIFHLQWLLLHAFTICHLFHGICLITDFPVFPHENFSHYSEHLRYFNFPQIHSHLNKRNFKNFLYDL